MLTADLVRVRQKGGELHVSALKGKTLERAKELAELYLGITRGALGDSYGQLKEEYAAISIGPREKKLADGLLKLIEDQCEFEADSPIEPRELRREVFLKAAELRRATEKHFERELVLEEVGQGYQLDARGVDAALFSDLKSQHQLTKVPSLNAETLVERYQLGQYQAVLLRAVKVIAKVRCKDVHAYRQLFKALKFRRLLYTIKPASPGYVLEIDGPFSLFESVTKYGLQLALVFPALLRCTHLELEAQLKWGKSKTPLTFHYEHKRARGEEETQERLPDEVQALWDAFERLGSDWQIQRNEEILDLPGVGVCIPDLVFTRGDQKIFFEVMGFWSREAVWKRVELVESGLQHKVVFAVSTRLRVSEAVLDEKDSAALYVYKGVMSAKAVLKKLEALAG